MLPNEKNIMNEDKKIVLINENVFCEDNIIKAPGDKMTKEMKPCGDIVTKVNTKERKAVLRQYMKKDGTPGKRTLTFMELELDND
ncbi:hypothetical protein [Selenomonas ruminantium]|uniref:hypothetical protein n=1 Tax=Selenomonas ruminantium TaxID=971 RepID=UPI0026EFCAD3|nr:hypothetical protein [Selenomonas ruminantium]